MMESRSCLNWPSSGVACIALARAALDAPMDTDADRISFIASSFQQQLFFTTLMNNAIANNRKAFHDYEVLEKVETGIALTGAEVKSVRAGRVNIAESYAQCLHGELFVTNLHISPYDRQGLYAPEPNRKRKLLVHKREIIRLSAEVDRKKLTLIPLSMYFKKQWVKVEVGLCRGRKKYDKRQKIAAEESKKKLAQLMKIRRSI
jgi:SsrA-binding protein